MSHWVTITSIHVLFVNYRVVNRPVARGFSRHSLEQPHIQRRKVCPKQRAASLRSIPPKWHMDLQNVVNAHRQIQMLYMLMDIYFNQGKSPGGTIFENWLLRALSQFPLCCDM